MQIDSIGLMKAVLWEEAKGKLRAMATAGGQIPSTGNRSPDWQEVEKAVEDFIKDFQDNGYHE